MARLEGKRVAILATDGFEQVELTEPRDALTKLGAEVDIVSPKEGKIQGFHHFDKGDRISVDRALSEISEADYDALVIPGGLFNPDALRVREEVLRLTRKFIDEGKPVAAICHGPWVLVNAKVVEGRQMTAVKTIHQDLENAGARVVDEEVVVDQNLITSRTPDDLPAFCAKLVEEVAQGRRAPQQKRGFGSPPPEQQIVS